MSRQYRPGTFTPETAREAALRSVIVRWGDRLQEIADHFDREKSAENRGGPANSLAAERPGPCGSNARALPGFV